MLRPDFVVLGIDVPEVRVVVEVRARAFDLSKTEQELKEYMRAVSSPLGLLVTPRWTRVYEDTYRDEPDRICTIAEADTAALIRMRGPVEDERQLEDAVRSWLDYMVRHPGVRLHRKDVALTRVEDYLVPQVVQARVAVTGPR